MILNMMIIKEITQKNKKKSWLETIKEYANDIADFVIEAKNFFTSEKGKKMVETLKLKDLIESIESFFSKTK